MSVPFFPLSSLRTRVAARVGGSLEGGPLSVLGTLLSAWVALNLNVCVSFPVVRDWPSWFLPCVEVIALVWGYGVCVWWRRGVPWFAHLLVVGWLVTLRAFAFLNGFQERFFHRPFRLAVDLPLVPEAVRLLVNTDGWLWASGQLLLLVLGLIALAALLYRLLRLLEHSWGALIAQLTTGGAHVRGAAGLAVVVPTLFTSWQELAESATGRIVGELVFLGDYKTLRAEKLHEFEQRAAQLGRAPHSLDRLEGRQVTFYIVESYGRGALESEQFAAEMTAALARLERAGGGGSRAVASRFLTSPTYGGGSWYAHATLFSGLKVFTSLDYDLLLTSEIWALSRYMNAAGYHTVNFMPGTTRLWPQGSFYGFDETHCARDFAYAGPHIGWGRFPDQLILDRLRSQRGPQPSYAEVKLVTSHVPWRQVPPVIPDWEQVASGEIYHDLPIREFDVKWSTLEGAHEPYMTAILYDLELLGAYLEQFEPPDALSIVLGDHQPVREAAGSDSWEVPMHVFGPTDLVQRFVAEGFVAGVKPKQVGPALPMEDFLGLFLRGLSTPELDAGAKAPRGP